MADLSISPCNVCPRACGARRTDGERGVCGADDRVLVARAALHLWEEPPLAGAPRADGTQAGSGAIFFAHCPMHCVFCQNAVIAEGRAGREVSVERLAAIMGELEGQGALNINCVTPTHYTTQIVRAVKLARAAGMSLPIVWNTSGYETVDCVRALAGTVDVFLDDFKYADGAVAAHYSHAADYPEVALAALDAMVEVAGEPAFDGYRGDTRLARGVVVRHMMLPGCLDDSKRVVRLLRERYGSAILLSLMNQYTPVLEGEALERFPELACRVPDDDYERLLDYADSIGCDDYFWQEGPAALESFIPAWDGSGL